MYVHKYENDRWWVGYLTTQTFPNGTSMHHFHDLRQCASSEEAAAFINYLNGGDGREFEPTDKSP